MSQVCSIMHTNHSAQLGLLYPLLEAEHSGILETPLCPLTILSSQKATSILSLQQT